MDKKRIDNIVWWIPFRKLRNFIRDFFIEDNKMKDTIDEINISVNELKSSMVYNNELKIYNDKIYQLAKKNKIFSVELETQNKCNGGCSFCPVSIGNDIRDYKEMSFELFNKIINNFEEMKFDGLFSLFSNNEPFLDKRMPEFLRIAKEKLPNACHFICTNGSMLTLELFKKIEKYLDAIVIDNYNDELILNPAVKIISDYIDKNPDYKKKVKIFMRKKNEVLTSRGGEAPNKRLILNNERLNELCFLPFTQFIIRPDGKISLCCNDAYGQVTLGDLNNQSVEDIWNSNKYTDVKMLSLMGREHIFLCKNCDSRHSFIGRVGDCILHGTKYAILKQFFSRNL